MVSNCPFLPMVSNCPRCQIVRFYPWCQIVRCQIVRGVKLSAVSNCPVSNCPVSNCPRCQIVRGVKLSWCQIVTQPKLLKIGRKRKRKVNVFQSGQKKVAKNREEAESNREGNGGEYSASVSSLLGNNLGAAHCGCVTYSKLLH